MKEIIVEQHLRLLEQAIHRSRAESRRYPVNAEDLLMRGILMEIHRNRLAVL